MSSRLPRPAPLMRTFGPSGSGSTTTPALFRDAIASMKALRSNSRRNRPMRGSFAYPLLKSAFTYFPDHVVSILRCVFTSSIRTPPRPLRFSLRSLELEHDDPVGRAVLEPDDQLAARDGPRLFRLPDVLVLAGGRVVGEA